MSLKTLVIFTNILFAVIIASLFSVPVILHLYTGLFISSLLTINFISLAFLLPFIVAVNLYFYRYRTFLALLLKEDWQTLYLFLTDTLLKQQKVKFSYIKHYFYTAIYLNANIELAGLEQVISQKQPKLLAKVAYLLTPFYLSQSEAEQAAWFAKVTPLKCKHAGYISWCYAFYLVSIKELTQAEAILTPLLLNKQSKDIVKLMAAFLLAGCNYNNEQAAAVKTDLKKLTKLEWDILITKKLKKGYLQLFMLRPFINSALNWLYSN
ncbi:MAG: hypothetical protein FWE37_04005 [Spirochaetaceae bacterium]|nr:hypothetical protein [Spirochaetaceae bacterium]